MRLWRFRDRGTAVQLPWLASLTLVLVLLVPSGGAAQPDRATVRVDGRPLFRVGAVEPASAEERAQRVERRLVLLLEHHLELRERPADPHSAAVRDR